MKIKDLYDQVCACDEYKESEFDYLAHFFIMLNDKYEPMTRWQVGFYNKENDHVVSFDVDKKIVKTESRAFKHVEHKVSELKLAEVKVDFEEALDIAKNLLKEKFPGNAPVKIVVLLQTIEGVATWNVTFITAAFNVLNIKLNASDKKIIHHEFSSLLSWKVN
ncbi:hypothetical protein KY335_03210 [Candidatus Woesearchaeota archaeon]|nr:hypothetical protein [Candidatus Woesearchaeota archaeon]